MHGSIVLDIDIRSGSPAELERVSEFYRMRRRGSRKEIGDDTKKNKNLYYE